MINLSTFIVFILPIAIYFSRENTKNFCLAAVGSMVLAILAPPFGLYRPHPYSDWERNKPWPRRE
jgi:hypothetical protein